MKMCRSCGSAYLDVGAFSALCRDCHAVHALSEYQGARSRGFVLVMVLSVAVVWGVLAL